jgi:hypothetical protein
VVEAAAIVKRIEEALWYETSSFLSLDHPFLNRWTVKEFHSDGAVFAVGVHAEADI